jgi:hypothetical protein
LDNVADEELDNYWEALSGGANRIFAGYGPGVWDLENAALIPDAALIFQEQS